MNNKVYLCFALSAITTIATGYALAAFLEYQFGGVFTTSVAAPAPALSRLYEFGDERGLNAALIGARETAQAQRNVFASALFSNALYGIFLGVLISGATLFVYMFWQMFSANCPGRIDRSGYEEI